MQIRARYGGGENATSSEYAHLKDDCEARQVHVNEVNNIWGKKKSMNNAIKDDYNP